MSRYQELQKMLLSDPQRWLVTGGAGFIGCHVVEKLLRLDQRVTVLDNLSTGSRRNLNVAGGAAADGDTVRMAHFVEGDIRDEVICRKVMHGIERVIHLGAMGSVSLSLEKPEECHAVNVTGTVNVFLAARDAGVKQIVYASSSAVYGDEGQEMKREDGAGLCSSPYAASKRMNEIYAQMLQSAFAQRLTGLRLFNVFGPRQNPNGAYAAVIPRWISAMKMGQEVFINGDGSNTRDFCFASDVVQALLLASMSEDPAARGKVFNVGLGLATSLNELFATLQRLVQEVTDREIPEAVHRDGRRGDILHSRADVSESQRVLGFAPEYSVMHGLRETVRADEVC